MRKKFAKEIGDNVALYYVHTYSFQPRLLHGVFCVGDRVLDDVLEEDLEDPASLFVDEARDALDSSSAADIFELAGF